MKTTLPCYAIRLLVPWMILLQLGTGTARAEVLDPRSSAASKPREIVEEFTASVLSRGEIKLGTETDWGLTDFVQIGTDLVADVIGAPSLQIKGQIWTRTKDTVSLGVRGAWLNKDTILWGSMDEHFAELSARVIRPSLAWTHQVSPRLKLHTHWGVGIGRTHAVLTEKGRRRLWSMKRPGEPWPGDGAAQTTAGEGGNPERRSAEENVAAQRSTQVQSIAGLAQDRFQITGEMRRSSGTSVLISTRVERTDLEEFRSQILRFTIAQHWAQSSLNFRLGGGVQYMVLSGSDLDGEKLDEAGWWPATDVALYWRF